MSRKAVENILRVDPSSLFSRQAYKVTPPPQPLRSSDPQLMEGLHG